MTARHCIGQVEVLTELGTVYFAVGADSGHPRRKSRVASTAVAPFEDAGWPDGYGTDLAIAYLAPTDAVTDIPPVRIAQLEDRDIGSRFTAIGYGMRNSAHDYGIREMGPVTLRARSGKVFPLFFGTFDAFQTWVDGNPGYLDMLHQGPDAGPPPTQFLRTIYDETTLLADQQAFLGGLPGDAQPCHYDSGGPLMRVAGGELVAYGVTTGAVGSRQHLCFGGVVYSTFDETTYGFVKDAAERPPQ